MGYLTPSYFLLLAFIVFIYLGLLHRVLDRMYLSSRGAILLILSIGVFSYLPSLPLYGGIKVSIGGFLIPLGLVIYILRQSDSPFENGRTLLVAGIVAWSLYLANQILPVEPGMLGYDLDPLYLPGLLAAFWAYLLGRSRRASFCGAILGVILLELIQVQEGSTLGGGGIFNAIIISGVLAVLLTEGFGEIWERLKT